MRERLTLVLLETGGAELLDEENEGEPKSLWSSDADEHFWDTWDGQFLTEEDEEEIWDYLIDEGLVTEEEADAAALEVEEYTEEELPDAIRAIELTDDGDDDESDDEG